MNKADTVFIIISAGLVLLMTPGLALFYGGMVRGKNVLGTIMQSLFMISLISIEWVYLGYSMSFGPSIGGFIGDLSWFGLSGVTSAPSPDYATTIPQTVFMIYQCMFAIITPALITGAFAERVKFVPFVVFSVLWAVCVYNPVCHWIWNSGGWLGSIGVMDFAGGLVVHATCGMAALAGVLVIGPRKGFGRTNFMPHNLPMTVLGTALLWFGWFGFNGGSAWLPTRLQPRPLSPLIWPAWQEWSCGWFSSGKCRVTRRPWVPPREPSPGWQPLRRRPGLWGPTRPFWWACLAVLSVIPS